MAEYRPSADEVERGLDEVYYEIEQLFVLSILTPGHEALVNPILECRLLHVRTLMDFFEQAACAQDDILATHYGFSASPLPIEQIYRHRLNKDLAHLTYSRTRRTVEDKPWPHERVIVPVLERSHVFIQHLLSSRQTFGVQSRDVWAQLMDAVGSELKGKRR